METRRKVSGSFSRQHPKKLPLLYESCAPVCIVVLEKPEWLQIYVMPFAAYFQLELKLGIGGTSYSDFISSMHLPMQLRYVSWILYHLSMFVFARPMPCFRSPYYISWLVLAVRSHELVMEPNCITISKREHMNCLVLYLLVLSISPCSYLRIIAPYIGHFCLVCFSSNNFCVINHPVLIAVLFFSIPWGHWSSLWYSFSYVGFYPSGGFHPKRS